MLACARRLALPCLVALGAGPVAARAQDRQLEVGLEGFAYESATTLVNQANLLGLARYPRFVRGTLGWRESHGAFRAVFRGYLERSWGTNAEGTDWVVRQAYAQYWWGEKLGVRVGKQRIAWGSGFAWNPTNRLEPPKNALNTTLEQAGALAARIDWAPTSRLSLVLVGCSSDGAARDLPFATAEDPRRTLALRTRVVVKDTDVALVFSGGRRQRPLLGLDLARELGGIALHAEAAVYEGAELLPAREGTRFLRVAAGALQTSGESAFALEYFWNAEGYSAAAARRWRGGLEESWSAASDPGSPLEVRQPALAAYAAAASIPYGWGLGLRRHYLHASFSRGGATATWTGAVRAVVGLADGGVALTPGLGYAPRGNVTLNLDALLLLGRAGSEYRLAPLRGALQTRFKVLF